MVAQSELPRIVSVEALAYGDLVMGSFQAPLARLDVTLGLGSGLSAVRVDGRLRLFGVSDRGPNIKANGARKLGLSVPSVAPDADPDVLKVMLMPEITPCIVELSVEQDRVERLSVLRIHDGDGAPVSGAGARGLAAPGEDERLIGIDGADIVPASPGIDSEGIAALRAGGFWVADEYVPSLLEVDAQGRVLRRLVPEGLAAHFSACAYAIQDSLPRVFASRKLNRGFEAICLSDDELSLYVMFQSPLAHPDRQAHNESDLVRLVQIDLATGRVIASWAYPLEPAADFLRDPDLSNGDRKVCEMCVLRPERGDPRLLVLERGSESTKLFAVELSTRAQLPAWVNDAAARPTLEQATSADFERLRIVPLAKARVLDSDHLPQLHGDIEGMVVLAGDEILLVNDNDFGVDGQQTRFARIKFDRPL